MGILDDKNFINQVSIDCVIFGYEDRKIKTLVSKLKHKGDFYSLPSGFVFQEEDVESAAERIINERTAITNFYLEQFGVFGKANRRHKAFLDKLIELNYPNGYDLKIKEPIYDWFTNRFISIGFYALTDIQNVRPQLSNIDEEIDWYAVDVVPDLIMDHNEILTAAYHSLIQNRDVKANAFKLLPSKFTISEVQEIYEVMLNRAFVRTNFQKKILEMGVLERLEKKFTGAKNKAPYLYKLKSTI